MLVTSGPEASSAQLQPPTAHWRLCAGGRGTNRPARHRPAWHACTEPRSAPLLGHLRTATPAQNHTATSHRRRRLDPCAARTARKPRPQVVPSGLEAQRPTFACSQHCTSYPFSHHSPWSANNSWAQGPQPSWSTTTTTTHTTKGDVTAPLHPLRRHNHRVRPWRGALHSSHPPHCPHAPPPRVPYMRYMHNGNGPVPDAHVSRAATTHQAAQLGTPAQADPPPFRLTS